MSALDVSMTPAVLVEGAVYAVFIGIVVGLSVVFLNYFHGD